MSCIQSLLGQAFSLRAHIKPGLIFGSDFFFPPRRALETLVLAWGLLLNPWVWHARELLLGTSPEQPSRWALSLPVGVDGQGVSRAHSAAEWGRFHSSYFVAGCFSFPMQGTYGSESVQVEESAEPRFPTSWVSAVTLRLCFHVKVLLFGLNSISLS